MQGVLCTANGTNPDADKSMGLFVDGQARLHARMDTRGWQMVLFEAIKVSCKHKKGNQLVSEVYYQGFNTDLEGF